MFKENEKAGKRNRKLVIAGLLVLIIASGVAAFQTAYRSSMASLENQGRERLSLYANDLRSEFDRLAHLPRTLALHPDAGRTLNGEIDASRMNDYLKSVNDAANGADFYLMDSAGLTIAASNHESELTFVGRNFRYRPYFQDAMRGSRGSYFAIGTATGVPGYFVSEPVLSGGEIIGVAVIKTVFEDMLVEWKRGGEKVMVTDRYGVVVLASDLDARFRTTRSITQAEQTEIDRERMFADRTLVPLEIDSPNGSLDGLITYAGIPSQVYTEGGLPFGWKIHYLGDVRSANDAGWMAALATIMTGLLAMGVWLMRQLRLERRRLQAEAEEAAEIRRINQKLEAEINTRKQAEVQLRDAQRELIQSSRLAALGKMSAAIVHEVNQPVSAIRTFAASGLMLLKRKDEAGTKDVLKQIGRMTERLGTITSDLLIFSRKPVAARQAVDINACVKDGLVPLQSMLDEQRIALEVSLWNEPLPVSGSATRFEQIVSNLVRNAAQATVAGRGGASNNRNRIQITTHRELGEAVLTIRDNGPGIAEEIRDQLFDPFFTTKPVGDGVGLGLAICYAITDEAGGTIKVLNVEEGGAQFTVRLPIDENDAANEAREVMSEHAN